MENSPLSRRRFLQAGAAITAGVALPLIAQTSTSQEKKQPAQEGAAPPATVQHAAATEFGGFLVGIQSYTFRNFPMVEQVLTRVADLGIHYVEFNYRHIPLTSTEAQINAIRKQCSDYGVTPMAFGVETFTRDHDANRRKFEFARNFGVRYFSADPDPDSFDSLDRLVSEYGIGIAIHPHGPLQNNMMHRWYSADVINRAISSHHRLIGTCLDTGHLIRSARAEYILDPASQIRAMGARNFGIHLKDNDNTRDVNVVFGRGRLNLPSVLQAMREVNFNGYVSIEFEANPDDPSPDVRACIDVLRTATQAPRT